ncbi:MAG: PEP-CTERM sorting domain-containing protein [Planctomycetota bacterium]
MRKFLEVAAIATALTAMLTSSSTATLIYETDYTTRSDNGNPFVDGGELRFQDGWLGQTGYIVDSDAPGTVTSSGAFLRTLNNRGATGGVAGGDGSGETGTDFQTGDEIKITTTLQFELATAANQALSTVGFRSNFVNGGFDAAPTNGFKVAYSSFADGSLKVFTNLTRQGFIGADNAFALFVTGPEGGFNSGGNGGATDLVTDTLEFEYTAVFGTDEWTATELIVRNLDNGGAIVAQGSVENPSALETSVYTGTEAFFAQRLTDFNGTSTTSDSMRFEYTAIPEPSSLILMGLASVAAVIRRR